MVWNSAARSLADPQLPGGLAHRASRAPCSGHRRSGDRSRREAERGRRRRRPRRSRRAPRRGRPHRRAHRRGRDRRRGAERRRLPDRHEHGPAVDDKDAACCCSPGARRRSWRRLVPAYPGDAPPVLPTAWLEPLRAACATRPSSPLPYSSALARSTCSPSPSASSSSPSRVPSGRVEPGSSRRQRHEHEAAGGCLGVREPQPVGDELDVAEQEQIDVECPRPVPRPAVRLLSASIALQMESRASGSRSVPIRTAALRKWVDRGSLRPARSHTPSTASTETPCRRSAAIAPRRLAQRSPTFEPRPR